MTLVTLPRVVTTRHTGSAAKPSARAIANLLRPWFWPVSLGPLAVGWVLASHRLLPSPSEVPRLALAALLYGPLLWTAVLLLNDAHDVPGDRLNPRKARSPLVTGAVTPGLALRISASAAAAAFAIAALLGPRTLSPTAVALALGWAYSAPPLRLKTRPGADLAANALAIGIGGPVSGWLLVRPITDYPIEMLVLGILVGSALYAPTLVIDYTADKTIGYATTAVRFGPRLVMLLGSCSWWLAVAGVNLLSAGGHLFPRSLLPFYLGMTPLLLGAYAHLARRPSFFRIAVVSMVFMICGVAFAVGYHSALGYVGAPGR